MDILRRKLILGKKCDIQLVRMAADIHDAGIDLWINTAVHTILNRLSIVVSISLKSSVFGKVCIQSELFDIIVLPKLQHNMHLSDPAHQCTVLANYDILIIFRCIGLSAILGKNPLIVHAHFDLIGFIRTQGCQFVTNLTCHMIPCCQMTVICICTTIQCLTVTLLIIAHCIEA